MRCKNCGWENPDNLTITRCEKCNAPLQSGSCITIGRHPENDIVINDPYIGRRHVQITQHDDGHYSIVDLGSTNGVYVNGSRISGEVTINNNDIIRIGHTTLNLEEIILMAGLREISIIEEGGEGSPSPPHFPLENAMCYCQVPSDWKDNKESRWARLIVIAIFVLIIFLIYLLL